MCPDSQVILVVRKLDVHVALFAASGSLYDNRPDFVFFAAHKSAYESLDKFILERSKLP